MYCSISHVLIFHAAEEVIMISKYTGDVHLFLKKSVLSSRMKFSFQRIIKYQLIDLMVHDESHFSSGVVLWFVNLKGHLFECIPIGNWFRPQESLKMCVPFVYSVIFSISFKIASPFSLMFYYF
jgi:hypothetical protein